MNVPNPQPRTAEVAREVSELNNNPAMELTFRLVAECFERSGFAFVRAPAEDAE